LQVVPLGAWKILGDLVGLGMSGQEPGDQSVPNLRL